MTKNYASRHQGPGHPAAWPAVRVSDAAEAEPTAEAIKQKKKRDKKTADDAAKGVEKVQVELAGGLKAGLKRLMHEHGFNAQQEVYQNLLRNVLAADFETAARMLECVTTPFVITQNVSRAHREESLKIILKDPGDEIIAPA